MPTHSRLLPRVAAVAFALLPCFLVAQDIDEEVILMDPFVVSGDTEGYQARNSLSATKFNVQIRDVPLTVTSLTQDFLEDTYAQTLEDALRFTAGVTEGASQTAEETGSFYIRGLRALRSKRNGIIQLYSQDMTNVQRVEVVKGPMSVLYGQVEPGGIINYITMDALPEFRTDLQVKVGNYGHFRTQLNHTGPILKGGPDKQGELLYRLDASWKEDDGWRDNTEDERAFYSGVVQFKPLARTTIELQWDYLEQDSYNTAPLPKINKQWRSIWEELVATTPPEEHPTLRLLGNQDPFASYTYSENAFGFLTADTSQPRLWDGYADHWPRTANPAPVNAFNDVDQHTTSVEVRHRLIDDWFTRLYVVHHDINRESVWGNLWGLGISGDGGPGYSWNHWDRYNDDWAYQLEVTGKWTLGPVDNETITGIEYLDTNFTSFLATGGFANLVNPAIYDDVIANPNNPVFSPLVEPLSASGLSINLDAPLEPTRDQEMETRAAFLSNVARMFDSRLLLLTGVRYDEVRIKEFNENSDGERQLASRFEQDSVSPQIGASWRQNDNLTLYASYSESFVPQSGSTPVLKSPAEIEAELSKPPADRDFTEGEARTPFSGTGYEVGAKFSLWDDMLSGSAAMFHIELEGVTKTFFVEVPGALDANGQPQTALVGSQNNGREIDGFEAELFLRPREGMQVIFSYAYIDSVELLAREVTDIREGADVTLSIPSVSVPEHQVGLWVKQEFSAGWLEGLAVGGGVSWLDERFGDYTLRSGNPSAASFVGDDEAVENRILLDAQTTFELMVSYTLEAWAAEHRFQLNVTNLTDEEFFLPGGNPNEPRRIFGSWKVSF